MTFQVEMISWSFFGVAVPLSLLRLACFRTPTRFIWAGFSCTISDMGCNCCGGCESPQLVTVAVAVVVVAAFEAAIAVEMIQSVHVPASINRLNFRYF